MYDLGSDGSQGVGVYINNDSSEWDIIDVLCESSCTFFYAHSPPNHIALSPPMEEQVCM